MPKDKPKILLQSLMGIVLLVFGITFILVWWGDVVGLFRGALGIALGLARLLTLYFLTIK